jgi:uncharacterized membrane protein
MMTLVLGLVVFLGAHSVRIVADDWRTRQVERLGQATWKGLYSLISLAGLVLIIWGYDLARSEPVILWVAPAWTHVIAALLTAPAFVLVVAAYVPRTRLRAAVGHPMVLGVKLWALAHLISNGALRDLVLFGAFLLWAVLDYRASRRRDRAQGTRYPAGMLSRDLMAIAVGLLAWAGFAFWLHGPLIGVRPFG